MSVLKAVEVMNRVFDKKVPLPNSKNVVEAILRERAWLAGNAPRRKP